MSSKLLKWAKQRFCPAATPIEQVASNAIPRSAHGISRDAISPNALKVLYRLKDAGYCAFLVGGGVRDILLKRKPKDFDVATDAHPEAIRAVFRNSRIIGKRFRLVHVFFGDEIIEVSTFRANTIEQTRTEKTELPMIHRDNTFGTIEEDAWRRDFTVNALYYNIADFSVVDYMHGMEDLKNRLIRMIGDPTQRYHEDPVRLLRAIRFAAKLNFELEEETESALRSLTHLLQHVPPSRLFDECIKLFFAGDAWLTYQKLVQYDYLTVLFPQTVKALQKHDKTQEKLIELALISTDTRLKENNSVNPAFLLAVFLWPVLHLKIAGMKEKKLKFYFQLHQFIHDIIQTQLKSIMIPKRLQFAMQTMWVLQFQLEKRRKSRIMVAYEHRYFRAAVDFMELRVQAGEMAPEIFNWWKAFQLADIATQEKMIEKLT
ncbi:MAG: polynucleotide adenylyltransferase PcnB [Gammaproteobacteria bacterium]|nr:polynucleotide adenylyltransferase PcnB [Gammaproteobacteria bacterium]